LFSLRQAFPPLHIAPQPEQLLCQTRFYLRFEIAYIMQTLPSIPQWAKFVPEFLLDSHRLQSQARISTLRTLQINLDIQFTVSGNSRR